MSKWLPRKIVAGALASIVLVGLPFEAAAREHVRRRFDPDDLELDEAGVVHADIAFGIVRGETAGRWLMPDFDIDIGLASNVELGLDGAWAIEGKPGNDYSFDHAAPSNLWINTKIALAGTHDKTNARAWAFGVQLGPRAPLAPDAHGTGGQAMALLGGRYKRGHAVISSGGMVDAGDAVLSGRPTAVLVGLDVGLDLDKAGTWSLIADLGGVFFFSADRNQIASTFGPVYAVASWLDVSVNGLVGVLPGGDQYGAFLQISPKVPVF